VKTLKQSLKFGAVGAVNTLLTLVIIRVMTYTGSSQELANVTGYAAGLVNSYFWNRLWTFRSREGWRRSAVRFLGVFGVCYVLQFIVLFLLNRICPEHPPLYGFFSPLWQTVPVDPLFYNQILAMLFYTALNFIINKYYTFKA
jgi:putative flippase GtrA